MKTTEVKNWATLTATQALELSEKNRKEMSHSSWEKNLKFMRLKIYEYAMLGHKRFRHGTPNAPNWVLLELRKQGYIVTTDPLWTDISWENPTNLKKTRAKVQWWRKFFGIERRNGE